ncbi:MAG TPA: hypothetical protein VFK38_00475 [Candidatus Limnocylindrales bacterium]|nr:hypothetical protein [Candidatus Limnocylindrales bacterium]
MYSLRSARIGAAILGGSLLLTIAVAPATAKHYSAWSSPASIETLPGSSSDVNTAALDGCPIQSPDGLSLYIASTRTGGLGGIDLWVAHRSSTSVGFGTPVNLTALNSGADDFCPTPVRGKGLFFVSSRGGNPDIYFARKSPAHGWSAPISLGAPINSGLPEFSPSYFEADGRTFLYFSRGPDIYSAELQGNGSWGSVGPVAELNSALSDFRPNVRKDGLEIVFDSNRHGRADQDLYFATRSSVNAAWSDPVSAGSAINTGANETRGSFSWDAEMLVFGRAPGPEGGSDIFFVTRTKVPGG